MKKNYFNSIHLRKSALFPGISHHLKHLNLWMMVLMFFRGWLAAELHGLLRAEVDAGEALRAMLPAPGLAIGDDDVFLRTDVGADAASNALLHIDGRSEHRQCATLHSRHGAQRPDRPPPGITQAMCLRFDLLYDTLQPRRILSELPHLVVGVSAEAQRTVVRNTDLLTVIQP